MNFGGLREKWFRDRLEQWYFITPVGKIHLWDGGADLSTSAALTTVDPLVFDAPELLVNAPETLTPESVSQLASLRAAHGFHFSDSYFTNFGGLHEKWFRLEQWYFITPDGTVHLWDGRLDLSTSASVATVDKLVFDDLALLIG